MQRIRSRTATLFLALSVSLATAATITIDETQEFQTIEGFGAFGGVVPIFGGDPTNAYNDAFGRLVIKDLGLTATRIELAPEESGYGKYDYLVKKLKAMADKHGEPYRVIGTVWSPPYSFKTNNKRSGYGTLKPESRQAFADWLVKYVQHYKGIGVPLYGISPANEPNLTVWYQGCTYKPDQYGDMFKVVAPQIHAKHPDVNIYGPDVSSGAAVQYLSYLQQREPEALKYLEAFGVHGYMNATDPDPDASGSRVWKSLADRCEATGTRLWMTETSGYTFEWTGEDDAWAMAQALFNSLRYGNLTLSTFWALGEKSSSSQPRLLKGGNPTKLYYVSKSFYRYIRPGAVRIASTDQVDGVEGVAFRHKQKNTFAIVLINSNTSSASVTLKGYDLPGQLDRYVTSKSKNCSSEGTVSGSSSITLPPMSLTTLYGTGYNPPQRTVTAHHARATLPATGARAVTQRAFALDGRTVTAKPHGLQPAVIELRDTRGRPVSRRLSVRGR